MTNRRLKLLGLLAAGTVLLVVLFGLQSRSAPQKTVIISGVGDCSSNIDPSIISKLGTTLYSYVVVGNDYKHRSSASTYRGAVRDGSCRQEHSNSTKGSNGAKLIVKTSSVIVDIPDAKQSWMFRYDWVKRGDAGKTDLGTLQPSCLTADELLYGDFGCDKVLSLVKYGTADYDPILQYIPYSGDGFSLDYSPPTRQVYATIIIPANQRGNTELIQNNEAIIPYWFEHRGLDINKYQISYNVVYQ
jgi:hypothetical protein